MATKMTLLVVDDDEAVLGVLRTKLERTGRYDVLTAGGGNEALQRIFKNAHQVHGAIGFSTEYDLQLFTRRAKATELQWGSTSLHAERVAQAMGL